MTLIAVGLVCYVAGAATVLALAICCAGRDE